MNCNKPLVQPYSANILLHQLKYTSKGNPRSLYRRNSEVSGQGFHKHFDLNDPIDWTLKEKPMNKYGDSSKLSEEAAILVSLYLKLESSKTEQLQNSNAKPRQ